MLFRGFLTGLVLVGLLIHETRADSWVNGRVVGVSDGDTLTLLTRDRKRVKVRLAGIDAPEKRQPYGQRSKQALSDMVFGRDIVVRVENLDRYGRPVGSVRLGGRDVNRAMVERGHAWAYRRYLPADSPLLTVERRARDSRTGLWALSGEQRVPPWQWRRKKDDTPARLHGGRAETGTAAPSPAGCTDKRFCRQMLSCAEANYYLRQCRLTHLDGDGDGIPCESLCRP